MLGCDLGGMRNTGVQERRFHQTTGRARYRSKVGERAETRSGHGARWATVSPHRQQRGALGRSCRQAIRGCAHLVLSATGFGSRMPVIPCAAEASWSMAQPEAERDVAALRGDNSMTTAPAASRDKSLWYDRQSGPACLCRDWPLCRPGHPWVGPAWRRPSLPLP